VQQAAAAPLPFGDGTVQTVVSSSTPIEAPTAKEMARVVAPGGKIVISGPNWEDAQKTHKLVIDAVGPKGFAWQRYANVRGVVILTTTIEVKK
jgi:SAM-dependent methyltransferase